MSAGAWSSLGWKPMGLKLLKFGSTHATYGSEPRTTSWRKVAACVWRRSTMRRRACRRSGRRTCGWAEGGGLDAGQRGAQGGDSGEAVQVGDVDGDCVERALDDDGAGASAERGAGLVQAEQHVALGEEDGFRAVQVLGRVVATMRMSAADERHRGAILGADGQHGPGAERVDQRPARGTARRPGRFDRGVGN